MSRRDEAVDWLQRGYSPSVVARQMGVTTETVMGYLYYQVGSGRIRRSDILFSIDAGTRDTIEWSISQLNGTSSADIYRFITCELYLTVNRDDLNVYLSLRDARLALGDLYEYIREIEVALHQAVKQILASEYGEEQWWRKGIPESIRVECVAARERDAEPASHPYCYTNFIHLKEIIDKQWGLFAKRLPERLTSEKKKLLSDLGRLDTIRNCVMHPVKGSSLSSEAFVFVRAFRIALNEEPLLRSE